MVMCSAYRKSCDGTSQTGSQVGDTVHDQIGVPAYAALNEKCDDNLPCDPKLISKLLNDKNVRIVVKRKEDGCQRG